MAVVPFSSLIPKSPSPPPLPPSISHHRLCIRLSPIASRRPPSSPLILRSNPPARILTRSSSAQDNSETTGEVEEEEEEPPEKEQKKQEEGDAATAVAELKEVLAARKKKEEGGLVGGVLEEVGEIEWPVFRKVVGTTGVVLAVIAGSSVALLTVNAVLAEISDRVFAGKGLQDFFG